MAGHEQQDVGGETRAVNMDGEMWDMGWGGGQWVMWGSWVWPAGTWVVGRGSCGRWGIGQGGGSWWFVVSTSTWQLNVGSGATAAALFV